MYGALVGDFQHSLSLFFAEHASQSQFPLKFVNSTGGGFAIGAILSMQFAMPDADRCRLERDLLVTSVHLQSHAGATGECCGKQTIRAWPEIFAAGIFGFVREKPV